MGKLMIQIWLFFSSINFILTPQIMINGICISQLPAVLQTHRAHSRRLRAILTQPPPPQSDPELAQVVRSRRLNHQKWKRFQECKKADQLNRENEAYQKKLQRIKMGSSIYHTKEGSLSSSVAHNFYNRKKLQLKIEEENPQLARRLIKMQSFISNSKAQKQYGKLKQIMVRLQKFPIIQRLTSCTHKTRHIKTEGDTQENIKEGTPSTFRYRSVPRRPKAHF